MESIDENELIDVDKVLGPTNTMHYIEFSRRQALLEIAGEGGLSTYAIQSSEKYLEQPSLIEMERARLQEFERFIAAIH